MTTFTRNNAWNQNGTFDNTDLLWYAKAVGVMQSRALDDKTSWWFYAAIHGEYITSGPLGYPRWSFIPGPPNVPTTPLPNQAVIDQYWKQCQHGTWFFPPWHRGYLYALENILREIVISLGGPDTWALPYWNYFGTGNEYQIPPAFSQQTLPDGSPNPLFVTARYGPNNNGNIFIPIAAWGINQDCQANNTYTGVQPQYYGGDRTGFTHGSRLAGSLESNPHNVVHVAIGGQNPNSGQGGLMSYPGTAAIDPIFYLHHANIDRMWAAWNNTGKNNPTDPDWLNGPTATGDRKFYMPKVDGTPWAFTPDMVNDVSQLDYTYDDLAPNVLLADRNVFRFRNLGVTNTLADIEMGDGNSQSELVGASSSPISVNALGAHTTVKLDSGGWKTVAKGIKNSFAPNLSAEPAQPEEVYLQLEGLKGNEDSIVCSVSVNQQYAGHISLFGLRNASDKDDQHGGSGLTVRLDISKIVDKLHLSDAIDVNSLDVVIQPVNTIAEGNELTIDRISVYRQGQG